MSENYKNLINLHDLEPKPTNLSKSIALVSVHKAATSYFSRTVLNKADGMVKIDYQSKHYNHGDKFAPIINPCGYIYGVLRLYDEDHPAKLLTDSLIDLACLHKLNMVVLIRDPRDLLVSMYYSFGFSHGLSEDKLTRRYQLKRRARIQSLTIDEYAVSELPILKRKLSRLVELSQQQNHVTILKYEEMILNFKTFFVRLQAVIPVNKNFESIMFADTRPMRIENINSQRRSGKITQYGKKLRDETVHRINKEIQNELQYFDYPIREG